MENKNITEVDFITPPPTVDAVAVSKLFTDDKKPPKRNTRTITLTIRHEVDKEWRSFLEVFTGTVPQRGKGISSATVQLGMRLVMAIIASFKVVEAAEMLHAIMQSDAQREKVANNLRDIANLMEVPQE